MALASTRKPDWEQRLADYLAAQHGARFAYGRHDCVLFAAGAVRAMTGAHLAKGVRGKYRGKLGAASQLKRRGWASLEKMMDAHFQRVVPAHAMRGDIVMAQGSLGICAGQRAWFAGDEANPDGPAFLPLKEWTAAWRVPFTGA